MILSKKLFWVLPVVAIAAVVVIVYAVYVWKGVVVRIEGWVGPGSVVTIRPCVIENFSAPTDHYVYKFYPSCIYIDAGRQVSVSFWLEDYYPEAFKELKITIYAGEQSCTLTRDYCVCSSGTCICYSNNCTVVLSPGVHRPDVVLEGRTGSNPSPVKILIKATVTTAQTLG